MDWEELSREMLCWEGVNAVGEDVLAGMYTVFYDRTVWTDAELMEKIRPHVTNVILVPESPRPDYYE